MLANLEVKLRGTVAKRSSTESIREWASTGEFKRNGGNQSRPFSVIARRSIPALQCGRAEINPSPFSMHMSKSVLALQFIDPDPVNLHGRGKVVPGRFLLQVGSKINVHILLRDSGSLRFEYLVVDLPDQFAGGPFQ